MKKPIQFKTPNRPDPAELDRWVAAGSSKDGLPPPVVEADVPPQTAVSASAVEPVAAVATRVLPPASRGGEKLARLTIDLPKELHAKFKSACALNNTKMLDEVRGFIEVWTQKHS